MLHKDKRFFVVLFFLIALLFLVGPNFQSGKEVLKKSYLPEILSKDSVVTFEEMEKFLMVWSVFLEKGLDKNDGVKIDFRDKKPSKVFPISTLDWLKRQGWDPDRFFEVEQRLRAITTYASRKKGSDSIVKTLEYQLSQTTDPEMAKNLMAMIDEQVDMYKDTEVSPSEVRMVMPNLEAVQKILDGEVIFRPTR